MIVKIWGWHLTLQKQNPGGNNVQWQKEKKKHITQQKNWYKRYAHWGQNHHEVASSQPCDLTNYKNFWSIYLWLTFQKWSLNLEE
jgi:hypothetical protein